MILFKNWTTKKIQEFVDKLEEMYLQGVRQSTFKDQTLIFGSTSELEQRLNKAYQALEQRGIDTSGDGSKRKKMIRMTSTNDGFQ